MEALNRWRAVLAAVGLTVVTLLTGCAHTPNYSYYRLQATAPFVQLSEAKTTSVGLDNVTLPVWMDTALLTWNEQTYTVRQSEFDRWSADPQDLVSQTVQQNLSRLLGHQNVTIGPWFAGERPGHIVNVTIQDLNLSGTELTLNATWNIKDYSRKLTVVNNDFSETIDLPEPNSGAVLARAFSTLLGGLSQAIAKQL